MNKTTSTLLTLVAVAAAGALVGYLLAGGKTEDLKENVDHLKDEVEKNLEKGKEILAKIKDLATQDSEETPVG
jgi:predicted acylesterase/phospholipase RssA